MAMLNVHSKSIDPRARRLSNFSADRFELDGERLASVEGFIQGTKFPPDDARRARAFRSAGLPAKKFGREAGRQFIWWRDRVIPYGSPEHRALIERAIRAKFAQNPKALAALLATAGLTLTHETGAPDPPNASLPAGLFCEILTHIRSEHLSTRSP